jgi:hypothetical protein
MRLNVNRHQVNKPSFEYISIGPIPSNIMVDVKLSKIKGTKINYFKGISIKTKTQRHQINGI